MRFCCCIMPTRWRWWPMTQSNRTHTRIHIYKMKKRHHTFEGRATRIERKLKKSEKQIYAHIIHLRSKLIIAFLLLHQCSITPTRSRLWPMIICALLLRCFFSISCLLDFNCSCIFCKIWIASSIFEINLILYPSDFCLNNQRVVISGR